MSHAAGGEPPDFGRRMSLSSLGGRKYGRAEPSGHGHSLEPRAKGSAKLLVRHIPIVVEAEESEGEVTYTGQTRLVTGGPVNIPIHYSWSIVYSDR